MRLFHPPIDDWRVAWFPRVVRQVHVCIPPKEVPQTKGRVDVLTTLKPRNSFTHIVDTTGDGKPDASPMVAGKDAYISVVAQQGVPDSLLVYVPNTPFLSLKHVVDAIESWGEQALIDRTSKNTGMDSVRDCDCCLSHT